MEACWAHNPEVGGSKPLPATLFFNLWSLKNLSKINSNMQKETTLNTLQMRKLKSPRKIVADFV